MAKFVIVRTKSGDETKLSVDSDLSEEKACQTFYKALDLENGTTLRLNNSIFFIREIESIKFVSSQTQPLFGEKL